ncbi:hypothetical protein DERF_000652 [Dermatophagoides farinae]|uniref:Uncharacterized protein n=1 Tax=Dermatophagoides farinae TaxID=6954 RepID=A0A922I964_DERFA|nr:hypothetical protein DERF_000652 [Dermatophagoides farinae]
MSSSRSSSLLLHNTLNNLYWQLYFDIYSQIQDVQLLSQLSSTSIQKHIERIENLQNQFDQLIHDYFGQNSNHFANNEWIINSLIELRRYLERSRIVAELALDRINVTSSSPSLLTTKQKEISNDDDCYNVETQSESNVLNAMANPFHSTSNISKTIHYYDQWQQQTASTVDTLSIHHVVEHDNESKSVQSVEQQQKQINYSIQNITLNDDDAAIMQTTVVNQSDNLVSKRPKIPLKIYDENGQPVDLASLSSSLASAAKKSNKSDGDENVSSSATIDEQSTPFKEENFSKNSFHNWKLKILLADLNALNMENKISEFIALSFEDSISGDDIERHLEQLYRLDEYTNDEESFKNHLNFLNKLFEFSFVQLSFMLRMYDHLLQTYSQMEASSSRNDFLIDCFAEFFTIARPLINNMINKDHDHNDECNRIRFIYFKRLFQRLSDIRQNYQNGCLDLSEKNVRIISMAIGFINKNQLQFSFDG